jgi:hypothetical protein
MTAYRDRMNAGEYEAKKPAKKQAASKAAAKSSAKKK